jgi:PTH2 family peptidyl-tRNA hydrolase
MYREDAPKQVIIIRKDLNMRKGKMIAQGAHASMKAIFDLMWNQNH